MGTCGSKTVASTQKDTHESECLDTIHERPSVTGGSQFKSELAQECWDIFSSEIEIQFPKTNDADKISSTLRVNTYEGKELQNPMTRTTFLHQAECCFRAARVITKKVRRGDVMVLEEDYIELQLNNILQLDSALFCIATLLRRNTRIGKLTIGTGMLLRMTLNELGRSLRFNNTLTSLAFQATTVDSTDLQNMISYLCENKSLNALAFRCIASGIQDAAILALGSLILSSPCLETIDLSLTEVSAAAATKLLPILNANKTIKQLFIQPSPNSSPELQAQLQAVVKRNVEVSRSISFLVDRVVNHTYYTSQEEQGFSPPSSVKTRTTDSMMISLRNISSPPAIINNKRFSFGVADTIGRRQDMEDVVVVRTKLGGALDQSLFCVFDGHGGDNTAKLVGSNFIAVLQQELLLPLAEREDDDGALVTANSSPQVEKNQNIVLGMLKTFEALDRMCRDAQVKDGACALVCFVHQNCIYTACAGDSNAFVARAGRPHSIATVYRPTDEVEAKRITDLGGFISANGRVGGVLAVSRSMGDLKFQPFVSAVPSIRCTEMSDSDSHIILGCDGVWDVISPETAVSIATEAPSPQVAAARLRDAAFSAGSQDNISVIVVALDNNT